jgi:hypothetical protein
MNSTAKATSGPAWHGSNSPQSRGAARERDDRLTAAPPAIFGLSLAILILVSTPIGRLAIGGPTSPRYQLNGVGLMIGGGVAILALLLLTLGAIIALVQRFPVRGYAWLSAAVMAISFLLLIAGDGRPYLVSPVIDVIIVATLLLLLGAVLGYAGRRGPLAGGLSGLGAAMILSLGVVWGVQAGPFSRLDLALLTAPLGLLYRVLLYTFVTRPDIQRASVLVISGLLCLTTMAAVERTVFWQWRLGQGQTGQLWILMAVGISLLAFGPVTGLAARRLRARAL